MSESIFTEHPVRALLSDTCPRYRELRNLSYVVRYATTLDQSACIWNVHDENTMPINRQDLDTRIKDRDVIVWSMNLNLEILDCLDPCAYIRYVITCIALILYGTTIPTYIIEKRLSSKFYFIKIANICDLRQENKPVLFTCSFYPSCIHLFSFSLQPEEKRKKDESYKTLAEKNRSNIFWKIWTKIWNINNL